MQRIYEPADLLEAQLLLGMLQQRGFTVRLLGADLLGAMGELPAMGLLGLMVPDEDARLARQLIDEYLSATPEPCEPSNLLPVEGPWMA
ncbi:Putative signal transducing protein [Atopomonas hussainii]|uniref:Putative signal transducing protein n=1 Tax=Atopomonas hussainii TaxID=1429083 RepID=A0A1H7RX35_9GAMM|nr:DUF2007 domain-containing protein [Atopomonas hussainii]SEL64589.1 Putative signal transducing protein [Atopomonas hussainii]